ncbi:ATP-binding cassette domain-containing protein, partial [bacterium]|nr:ATP-binding cassette domain-containing protein [bacterium]
MIEIVDVYKSFENEEVLKGVNLKIEKGQTLLLVGGSGKGKSILLKHIVGLLKPDKGKIFIDQQDISSLRGKKLKKLKERFGIVFQGGALFDSLTVFENVAFPLEEKTKLNSLQIRDKVLKELSQVGLEGDENKYPAQISGGMRKRVALARCLVMNP